MAEIFDYNAVYEDMKNVENKYNEISNCIKEINTEISEMIQKDCNSAIYGKLGKKIIKYWDENSSTFGDFHSNFESWSRGVIMAANNYKDYENAQASK